MLHETTSLALLWYVLLRRGQSWVDLGFGWEKHDIARSIVLQLGGWAAFTAVYHALYSSGLTAVGPGKASALVEHYLFGGGIFGTTFLFQFLNPFFEELIVRAYVMTEIRFLTNSLPKAIMVSTLLQTSCHFYQGAPVAIAHGATFLLWSVYYAKTNRIGPVILAHLYADVGGTLWYALRQ
jgi:membrane protease YdiL (CAAX protease family)